MILENITDAVGRTPLVHLSRIEHELSLSFSIYAKAEYFNPGGSVKDRVAAHALTKAEHDGLISPKRTTLIEPTSGNTGIGIAMFAAAHGYKCIIVMPDSMSKERRQLMAAYGAQVVLTPGTLGMRGAIEEAQRMSEANADSFTLGQFDNSENPRAHMLSTAPEIYEDMGGDIDAFVCGIGTGGTISGVGTYLKEKVPAIAVIGAEPAGSPVLSLGTSGAHRIQGIGAGFVPKILRRDVIDRIIRVTDEEAIQTARLLAHKEGLAVGISSGAAMAAALSLAKDESYGGKRIVVLLPDSAERYLSVDGFIS